jgi:hypothetical protein
MLVLTEFSIKKKSQRLEMLAAVENLPVTTFVKSRPAPIAQLSQHQKRCEGWNKFGSLNKNPNSRRRQPFINKNESTAVSIGNFFFGTSK